MTSPGVQLIPDAIEGVGMEQGKQQGPTPREEHVAGLIQHLRERRQSYRAQLENLQDLEAKKSRLEEKIQHVEADLFALGWIDPAPVEQLIEAEASVPRPEPTHDEVVDVHAQAEYQRAVAASKAAVEASWREHHGKRMREQAEQLRARNQRAAQAAGTDEPAEHHAA